MAPRGKKVALVVAVAAGMLLAWRLGVFTSVSEPRAFAEWLRTLGVMGWVLFVLAYAALQPFGVPGTVFVLAAPLIWPWPIAFALSMTGTMAASVIGFSFSRYVARDWVSKRIPKRFEKYAAALEKNGLQTTFILRLLFWMPQALHAFLGVSKVRFWTHFWGSFLGYIPTLLVISWLGSEMFDDAGHLQPRAWPIMGSFVAFSLLLVTVLRLRNRRAAKAVTSDG